MVHLFSEFHFEKYYKIVIVSHKLNFSEIFTHCVRLEAYIQDEDAMMIKIWK